MNEDIGAWEADALWPAEMVVVETDGWDTHRHRAAFERDRAKDAALAARGYVVLRFTWRQLMDEPVLVAARIAQTLALRGGSSGSGGPWATAQRPPRTPASRSGP